LQMLPYFLEGCEKHEISDQEGSNRWRWIERTSSNSVGNGPPPTRVVYAFTTPMTFRIFLGGIPNPVHTPPMVVDEDVTYGYVPKSISSISALAPSTRTRFEAVSASCT
jgi:hypothetical protein